MLFVDRQIQDPASQRLTWYKPPLAVLVIKKVRDQLVLPPFVQLVEWLIQVLFSARSTSQRFLSEMNAFNRKNTWLSGLKLPY